MSSRAGTVAYLVGQVAAAGQVSSRGMFGEHAIYCDGRLVALVCDDQLFVKPTQAGRAHLGEHAGLIEEAPPYPGAKPCWLVPAELWDDADWLATLVRVSAAELPLPDRSRRKGRGAARTAP